MNSEKMDADYRAYQKENGIASVEERLAKWERENGEILGDHEERIEALETWQHALDKYAEDVVDGKDVEFPLTSLEKRIEALADELFAWMTVPIETFDPILSNVVFMFYHPSACKKHIEAAKEETNSVRVCSLASVA